MSFIKRRNLGKKTNSNQNSEDEIDVKSVSNDNLDDEETESGKKLKEFNDKFKKLVEEKSEKISKLSQLKSKLNTKTETKFTANLDEFVSATSNIKAHSQPPVNKRVVESNYKSTHSINLPKPKVLFPYLVEKFNYYGRDCSLWSINTKLFQLTYDGDLDIFVDGKKKDKIKIDENWGYVFYKHTKSYMDSLNKLLEGAPWKEKLNEELPEIKEYNPGMLWSGTVNGVLHELCEYTDKSVAIFTNLNYSKFVKEKIWLTTDIGYMHPEGDRRPGYCIAKSSKKGLEELQRLVPINFGLEFVKSSPIATPPIQSNKHEQTLLGIENHEIEDEIVIANVYDYGSESFALIMRPDVTGIDVSGFMRNEKLKINGETEPGYIIAKSNITAVSELQDFVPAAILSFSKAKTTSTVSEVKEESIEDIINKLMIRLNKLDQNKIIKTKLKGKIFYYGNTAKIENEIEDAELLFEGGVSETVRFYVVTDPDK